MEFAIGYVAIIFVLQAIAAVRNPYEDNRTVFVASVFWIFILPLVAGSFALDAIGWSFDVVRSPKWFYFRKPTNPKAVGYALTLFKLELQLFKVAK